MEKLISCCAKSLSSNSCYSEDIMAFCIKLWLSTILQTIFLFIISVIFFDIKIFCGFVIVFCTLRSIIEGYHCKTFLNCFMLTNFMYLIVICVSYISLYRVAFAFFGLILLCISVLGLTYKSIMCFNKKNNLTVIYGVLRLLIVLSIAAFIILQLYYCGLNSNVYIWVVLYAYCLVYILSIGNCKTQNAIEADNA